MYWSSSLHGMKHPCLKVPTCNKWVCYEMCKWIQYRLWIHGDSLMLYQTRAPFQKGLGVIASFLNTRFAIDLRLISIIRLIATLCETGPRSLHSFRLANIECKDKRLGSRLEMHMCVWIPCLHVHPYHCMVQTQSVISLQTGLTVCQTETKHLHQHSNPYTSHEWALYNRGQDFTQLIYRSQESQ